MKINCNETLAVSLHRVFNADLNEHGTVFGGRILELVDGEASVAAMRVTRSTVVTALWTMFNFLNHFNSKTQCAWKLMLQVLAIDH